MELPDKPGPPLVDPNCVYLTGFSAGGDGVYRLATAMPDLFAAVNISAGHPGEVQFESLANLPICLQCGDKDAVYNKGELQFHRGTTTIESARKLNTLRGTTSLYDYQCYIHKDADHNSWERSEDSTADWFVLNQYTNPPMQSKGGDSPDATSVNTNELVWMESHTRNPLPTQVVWNLESMPKPLTNKDGSISKEWTSRRLFYWLYLRGTSKPNSRMTGIVRAAYDKSQNLISIEEPRDDVGIMLNSSMVNFSAPIKVQMGKPGGDPFKLPIITPSADLEKSSLRVRHDSNWKFSAFIFFDSDTNGKWTPSAVTSFHN